VCSNMKRFGKCVNKKAYGHRSLAISVAASWYKKDGSMFGVYECPTCLDFHLTSKYCNLIHLHKRWTVALSKELRTEEIRFDNKFFTSPDTKAKRKAKRNRYKANQSARLVQLGICPHGTSKKRTTEILSQAKMAEIFSTFDSTVYPQPRTFRSWILGIIN